MTFFARNPGYFGQIVTSQNHQKIVGKICLHKTGQAKRLPEKMKQNTTEKEFAPAGVMTINEACERLRMGRTSLWKRLKSGQIDSRRDGDNQRARVKICRQSVEDYLANLPDAY